MASEGGLTMSIHRGYIKVSIALALTSVTLFTISASGQSQAAQPNSADKGPVAAQGSRSGNAENKVAASEPKPGSAENKAAPEEPKPNDLQSEITAVKAENAAVRELLRKMAEQQKTLLEQVDRLQRRLDGGTATDVSIAGHPIVPPATADASAPAANASLNPPQPVTNSSSTSVQKASAAATQTNEERFRDGMIIWQTPVDAKVPFLLRFNDDTQLRYLNTQSSDETFTDHLGVVREVHRRNDITVNRSMFNINGYIFDPRLGYSLKVWTSAGAASIVVTGNLSWAFNEACILTVGYTGVPGSRSLVATFPYFQAIDRSMADNFFRPGFTQGAWVTGEPVKGLIYQAFLGNGLNTLGISATKIDTNMVVAGSVWWEPLGAYGEPGKSRHMYDDYFSSKKVRIRIGTSFTRSREDRFSNLDQSNPDNTALHNSDGVLTFSTGAFALGVTVDEALYKMWAIDGGLKWNGLAINGQYYARWLSDFVADGPLPLSSTFDHGFELTAGHFVIPKTLELYGRGSAVFGQFRNSSEYGGGARWYFLPTERLWLNAELIQVNHSPYGGAFTPYTTGLRGLVPMLQTVLAF
jgi:hypothetical protein